jgi:prepilin-type N-terminal cleavage/methylation domain-containing protein
MKGTLNPMRNLPPPAAVFNVLLRSACRHFLLIGAIALGTGLIHAGEQKNVFSGNFSKGHLDGWTALPTVVAISGKGLESIGKVGVARCRLERSTGEEGSWIFKAKVWPKVPPGGFTLIEILVVMAIIAALTAGPRIVSETSHVDELLMKTTYL